MRLIGILPAVLTAALWCVAPSVQAQAPSAAAFAERPAVGLGELSPSGRYLAFVVRRGDNAALQIRDLETGQTTPIVGSGASEGFGGTYIEWVYWKSDDRLIVSLASLRLGRIGNREDGDVFSASYDRSVLSIARDGINHIALTAPRATPGDPGELLDMQRTDPDHVLMTFGDRGGGFDVARVNVLTGESERIVDGDRHVLDYMVDRTGAVVARMAARGANYNIFVMEALGADGRWTEVFRMRKDEIRAIPDYEFYGPTDKPNTFYVGVGSDIGGEATAGVHIYDFATRTLGPTLWRSDRYDVAGVVIDQGTREFLGGCYVDDVFRCDFTDPARDGVMRGIRRFLGPQYSVTVMSQAREGGRWLIYASAPNDPGQYYLYDTAANRLTLFTGAYRLPTAGMGTTTRLEWQAADGQALFGYLTRPAGAPADAKPPLVVMPHGGPEVRDSLAYDVWVQFLASRGYQVFQPNFRGSAGMGKAFAEAGYRQWGLIMQDDVTSGVEHLAAAGLADADQVCIVGASYGGYAALQAGATRPDLYRCVVSVSGASDLVAMMRWERSEHGGDSDTYEYWLKSIGDPDDDRERLDAASPIRHVADWRPPVLLIHGDVDGIVPVEQSRAMERALKRAGKDVRLIELENQGHNGWTTTTETRVMTEMEAFLARHLPVGTPPSPPAPAAP